MIIEYLTAILVLVTTIYAYLTYKIAKSSEASVKAMEEQSEAISRPYVTVSLALRSNTTILYLTITNTGKTGAKNLGLSIDKDFFMFGEIQNQEKNLRSQNAFTQRIDSLPPGAELKFPLAQGFVIFDPKMTDGTCPKQFAVTAEYEYSNKQVREIHQLDLRAYKGTSEYLEPIADEIEKLRKVIEKK